MEYEFTLIYSVDANGIDEDEISELLFGHGCDDALIGMGRRGILSLDFCREAPSAGLAMCSASTNVGEAFPKAKLLEVKPDIVSVTDISRCLGITRQAVAQHVNLDRGFPNPLYFGSPSLWHLDVVLKWYRDNSRHNISDALLEVAEAARELNGNSRNSYAPLIAVKRRSLNLVYEVSPYTEQVLSLIESADYGYMQPQSRSLIFSEPSSTLGAPSKRPTHFASTVVRSKKDDRLSSSGWQCH